MPPSTSRPWLGQPRWLMTLGLLLIALHGQARACLCISNSSSEQRFLDASLLFRGELLSLRELSEAERRRDHHRPIDVALRGRYRVLESFKGPTNQAIIEVDSPADSCGFNDRIGAIRLMVAAGDASAGYTSDLCHFAPDPESMQLQQRKRAEMDLLLLQHPGDKQSHSTRARYFLESHAFEQAITAYQALLQLWPSDTEALLAVAQAQMSLLRYEAALAGFDTLLTLQAEQPDALSGRQGAMMRLNRHAELARPGLDLRGYRAGFREHGSFAGANLQGAQFQNAQLGRIDFSRADLSDSDFRGASLVDANFSAARLDGARFATDLKPASDSSAQARTELNGADFSHTQLRGTDFANVNLYAAKFKQAQLLGVSFKGAQLNRVDWSGARIENVDLSGQQLDGAQLRGTVFVKSSLRGASFLDPSPNSSSSGSFSPTDLRGADLSGALLDDVVWIPALIDCHTRFPADLDLRALPLLPLWQGCEGSPPLTGLSEGYPYAPRQRQTYPAYAMRGGISFSYFEGRNMPMQDRHLAGYNVSDSDFSGSDFSRADLRDMAIDHSNFEGSDFRQANLQRARFWKVSLRGSDWRGADLRGAIFLDLDLRTTQLASARFEGACYNAATRWPAGFQTRKAGLRRCEAS